MQQLDKNNKELTLRLDNVISNNSDGAELLLSLYKYQGIVKSDILYYGVGNRKEDRFTEVRYEYMGEKQFIKDYTAVLKDCNKNGFDFYFSISIYNSEEYQKYRSTDLINLGKTTLVNVDIDKGDYRKSSFRPLLIWNSSPNSIQGIYDIGYSKDFKEFEEKVEGLKSVLKESVGIDCIDGCRYLRVPGSCNNKPKRIQANEGIAPKVGNVKIIGNSLEIVPKTKPKKEGIKFVKDSRNLSGKSLDKIVNDLELTGLRPSIDYYIEQANKLNEDRSKKAFCIIANLIKFNFSVRDIANLIEGEPDLFPYIYDKWETKSKRVNWLNGAYKNAIEKHGVVKGEYLINIYRSNTPSSDKGDNSQTPHLPFIVGETKKGEPVVLKIIENIKLILGYYGWELYEDVVLRRLMIVKKGNKPEVLSSNHSVELHSNMIRDFNLSIPIKTVDLFLRTIATENGMNLISDYMKDCYQWYLENKKDYIQELADNYLVYSNNEYKDFYDSVLRKWLIQAVYLIHNDEGKYNPEFVYMMKGGQGKGKTTFAKKLVPEEYRLTCFREGHVFRIHNKDSVMEGTTVFITELGETEESIKNSSIGEIKTFFTRAADTYRVPYGLQDKTYNRRTSFIGTTNENKLLKDRTGNRRFVVIELNEVKWIDEFNLRGIWGQAYEAFINKEPYNLSNEEKNIQNTINDNFLEDVGEIDGFFTDCIERNDEYGITKTELYKAYTEYCEEVGYKYPIRQSEFLKQIEAKYKLINKKVNLRDGSTKKNIKGHIGEKNGKNNYYVGIKIKSEIE